MSLVKSIALADLATVTGGEYKASRGEIEFQKEHPEVLLDTGKMGEGPAYSDPNGMQYCSTGVHNFRGAGFGVDPLCKGKVLNRWI